MIPEVVTAPTMLVPASDADYGSDVATDGTASDDEEAYVLLNCDFFCHIY